MNTASGNSHASVSSSKPIFNRDRSSSASGVTGVLPVVSMPVSVVVSNAGGSSVAFAGTASVGSGAVSFTEVVSAGGDAGSIWPMPALPASINTAKATIHTHLGHRIRKPRIHRYLGLLTRASSVRAVVALSGWWTVRACTHAHHYLNHRSDADRNFPTQGEQEWS